MTQESLHNIIEQWDTYLTANPPLLKEFWQSVETLGACSLDGYAEALVTYKAKAYAAKKHLVEEETFALEQLATALQLLENELENALCALEECPVQLDASTMELMGRLLRLGQMEQQRRALRQEVDRLILKMKLKRSHYEQLRKIGKLIFQQQSAVFDQLEHIYPTILLVVEKEIRERRIREANAMLRYLLHWLKGAALPHQRYLTLAKPLFALRAQLNQAFEERRTQKQARIAADQERLEILNERLTTLEHKKTALAAAQLIQQCRTIERELKKLSVEATMRDPLLARVHAITDPIEEEERQQDAKKIAALQTALAKHTEQKEHWRALFESWQTNRPSLTELEAHIQNFYTAYTDKGQRSDLEGLFQERRWDVWNYWFTHYLAEDAPASQRFDHLFRVQKLGERFCMQCQAAMQGSNFSLSLQLDTLCQKYKHQLHTIDETLSTIEL